MVTILSIAFLVAGYLLSFRLFKMKADMEVRDVF